MSTSNSSEDRNEDDDDVYLQDIVNMWKRARASNDPREWATCLAALKEAARKTADQIQQQEADMRPVDEDKPKAEDGSGEAD